MIPTPFPPVVALAIRQRFDRIFRDLRLAEDTLNHFNDPDSRAILAALARAESALGDADVGLRHLVPDDTLYGPPDSIWSVLRTHWGRKK